MSVTKFHPAGDVALLAELGVTDVAENREQEARAKAAVSTGERDKVEADVKKLQIAGLWATMQQAG